MTRVTEAEFTALVQRGKHPLKAIDTMLKVPAPIYKNKWEENFAYTLVLEQRTGLIQKWGYEVMTLKLAKGKYHRPDFTIWHLDGSIEQAAVKGYHKNLRDSMTHLVWAAQQHPWFLFTIHRRSGGGWERSELELKP